MTNKALARKLQAILGAQGYHIKYANALHALAAMHGLEMWNSLAARPETPMLPKKEAMQALATRLSCYGVKAAHLVFMSEGTGLKFYADEQSNFDNMTLPVELRKERGASPSPKE